MRRLLVKLVAIETAFLGWISYWLFLVYANNPSITDQLASQLQRFPQLSFTTVDIAVLVIIATLSIILAFKFHRGLKPGIRLERALQMLENLMKRNLVLEAQVAELKIEKAHVGPPMPASSIAASSAQPRPGSWEKAFRTPLEAGPPAPVRSSAQSPQEIPFEHETGVPPSRIDVKPPPPPPVISAKPPLIIAEKMVEKPVMVSTIVPEKIFEKPSSTASPSSSSNWEDSPKYMSESKGILTPSPPPRRVPSVSESRGLRQPYIPAPAPKAVPASVIVGPMTSRPPSQAHTVPRTMAVSQASPRSAGPSSISRPASIVTKPPVFPTASPSSAKPPLPETKELPGKSPRPPSPPPVSAKTLPETEESELAKLRPEPESLEDEKTAGKAAETPKKKLPLEKDSTDSH